MVNGRIDAVPASREYSPRGPDRIRGRVIVAAESGGAHYSRITPAQGGGCPGDAPLACPGTNRCCPSGTPYYCQSLTRPHPEGRAAVGWSGCVMPGTGWNLPKFWSSACQPIWEKCN